jgi:competence protein ComEC
VIKPAGLLAVAAIGLIGCNFSDVAPGRPAQRSTTSRTAASRRPIAPRTQRTPTELLVRVLDVGQGDATLIENGSSRVLIDGGPDSARFGALLDSLDLNDSTIDVVILSHQHADHLIGLRALFETERNITIKYFFENQDPYSAANLRHLRDSINARVERGQLVYRDTDDPCSNDQPICTITMNGGAKLHIMRPLPNAANPNNRSVAVKLVGPDSASFTMWLAGDAEQEEITWFLGDARYDVNPGMKVDVLKADHHGSCNGVTDAYLDATHPTWATASVANENSYHHMHEQAKAEYRARRIPWYRTDQNGTITIKSPGTPGGGFTITPQRPGKSLSGESDGKAGRNNCA